jgi:hypothetical protein
MSQASDYLVSCQEQNPPSAEHWHDQRIDRVTSLYHMIEPNVPKWTKTRYANRLLVIGEVCKHAPEAFTKTFDDGSHAVIITSGYLHIFDVIAREVSASLDTSPTLGKLTPRISHADAIHRVTAWLNQYVEGDLFEGFSLMEVPLELSDDQGKMAENLSTMAGLFTLCHELAHVSYEVNNARPLTESLELDADIIGFTFLIAASRRIDLGAAYAGAHFAVRLHACLEKGDFKFEQVKASMSDRVDTLKRLIRSDFKEYMKPGDLRWAWPEAIFDLLLVPVGVQLAQLSVFAKEKKETGTQNDTTEAAIIQSTKEVSLNITQAATRLAELKRLNPPWEWAKDGSPLDRTTWYCKMLDDAIPFMKAISKVGTIAIGEVGSADPKIEVQAFDDGSQVVVVNSGLLHLLIAVSRFLQTQVAVRRADGKVIGSLLPHEQTVLLISRIFVEVARGTDPRSLLEFALPGFWPLPPPPGIDAVPLTDEQIVVADELAHAAGCFLVLAKILNAFRSKYEPSLADVLKAVPGISGDELKPYLDFDREGYGERSAAIWLSQAVPQLGFRQTFAASLFAVRVLICIDVANNVSSSSDPASRVLAAPWRAGGSDKAYQYLHAVGMFYDSIMQSIIKFLSTGEIIDFAIPPLVFDRNAEEDLWARHSISWWIAAGMGRSVKQSETRERVLEELVRLSQRLTVNGVRSLADSLINNRTIKGKLDLELPDDQKKLQKREMIEWLIPHLPEREKNIFREAWDAPWPGAAE